MKTQTIVQELLKGNTVSIIDNQQRIEVRDELRRIKNICTEVLSQIKNN